MNNTYRRHQAPAFSQTLDPYNPWTELPFALLIPLSYYLWILGLL